MATERKLVPEVERTAITNEIRRLLREVDTSGNRKWSQSRLGAAAGGLSQETIRKAAADPSGVGPAVRDGILKVSGKTIEQLTREHVTEGPRSPAAALAASSPSATETSDRVAEVHHLARYGRARPENFEELNSLRKQMIQQLITEKVDVDDAYWASEVTMFFEHRNGTGDARVSPSLEHLLKLARVMIWMRGHAGESDEKEVERLGLNRESGPPSSGSPPSLPVDPVGTRYKKRSRGVK